MSRVHLVIPDVQDKPGAPKDHLTWIGKYIRDYKPNVVVNLGDFTDMESLCSYEKGKRSLEGTRIKADIESCKEAMQTLLAPMISYNAQKRKNKEAQWWPEMHLTLGNHEDRLARIGNDDPQFEGLIGIDDLEYEKFGWTVHKYLKLLRLDGVTYTHYFYRPASGKPYGGSIETRLKNIGFTFTQGHQQGKIIGSHELSDGSVRRGLVVGSCYLYNPSYRGPQAQSDWRGVIVKHEVADGDYDLMEVSLDYLCRRYEQMKLNVFMKEKYPELVGG
jgi:hypothetical protein